MTNLLYAILRDPTRRNIIINTLGNYMNVFFTAFFALVLVRILSPAQYGVLSVLLGIAYVLANVLDFGTTATIYGYLPPLYETRDSTLHRFIKSTLYYQTIFSFIVITILAVTFPTLDRVFFKTGAPIADLYLTSISVLLFIWQNSVWNCLCAAKKFFKANLYQNLSNLIKTLILFYLAIDGRVSVTSVIFVFGILGPLFFFFFLFLEKRNVLIQILKSDVERSDFRFGYTLTFFLASQFFNLGLRMDLFLLSYFSLRNETGYYGLAQKIILTVITTVVSITQVLSPSFSNIEYKKDVAGHVKTALFYLAGPAALFLLLYLLPDIIFNIAFTERYAQTANVTRALSLPFIVYSLGSLPMLFLLYTIKKPIYILIANIVFFFTVTIGSYRLIPISGVIGPPQAIGVAMVAATAILTVASVYEYKRMKR